MQYAYGDSSKYTIVGQAITRWYAEKTGNVYANTPFMGLAIFGSDNSLTVYETIKGVILFDNYEPEITISMHAHAPGCMNKDTIKTTFNYVFNQLGCQVLRCIVNINNKKLTKALYRLNFEDEAILSPYFKDGDAILFKLKKQDIPLWVKLNVGTEAPSAN